jgi:soluble lytic murein transglycosylase-like protein
VAFAVLAASPARAEEPAHKTLVVRADPRTGRLVRRAVVPPAAQPSARRFSDLVDQAAQASEVDPLLVDSIIQVESGYNPYAISPKGAEGLMQLTPATARMLGVGNSFDPQQNIEAGVKYLKYLQSVYKDDRLALAAYNAGPAAVEKFKWIPPYPETRTYVDRVAKRYGEARQAAAEQAPAPQPPVSAPLLVPDNGEERHPKIEQFVDQYGSLHLRTIQ